MTQKIESNIFVLLIDVLNVFLDFIHVIKPCICELSGYITECIERYLSQDDADSGYSGSGSAGFTLTKEEICSKIRAYNESIVGKSSGAMTLSSVTVCIV